MKIFSQQQKEEESKTSKQDAKDKNHIQGDLQDNQFRSTKNDPDNKLSVAQDVDQDHSIRKAATRGTISLTNKSTSR